MNLVVLGPRLLLEKVTEAAGVVYTGINALKECVVRRIGTGISKHYDTITEGDHVLIPASTGQELQIPGRQGLILVNEEDILIKIDQKRRLLRNSSASPTASSH